MSRVLTNALRNDTVTIFSRQAFHFVWLSDVYATKEHLNCPSVKQTEIRFNQLLKVNSKMEVYMHSFQTKAHPPPPYVIWIRAKIRKCYGSVSIAARLQPFSPYFSLATRSDCVHWTRQLKERESFVSRVRSYSILCMLGCNTWRNYDCRNSHVGWEDHTVSRSKRRGQNFSCFMMKKILGGQESCFDQRPVGLRQSD
jgi:hypothetical protein